MKKIILMGPINQKTSLGIYTRILVEKFLQTKKFEIINKQRDITDKSGLHCIISGIFGIFSMIFPGRYSEKDIIFIPHSANLFPPILFGTKAKKVHIVHDFFYYDKEFFNTLGWFHKKIMYPFYYLKIHKFLYKIAFRKADNIIAISEATKKEILRKFGNEFENKISVIYNGIDHEIFQNNKKIPKPNMIPNKKYILYIGSELERKNLKNIIAGFAIFHKKHPEYIFIKAPKESGLYRNMTLKYIEENNLKINENFFFLDQYFQASELVGFYQNAELFMFPSLQEGFGLPILEAQACGVPVITSNIEPMSELVPYKNFLVDPNNPEDIAKKMCEIIENPNVRKKLQIDGLNFCKNFSWNNTAQKIIEIFEK